MTEGGVRRLSLGDLERLVALERQQPRHWSAGQLRRRGLAAMLLTAVVTQCRRWGSERLLLEVRAGNAAAVALYRRAGFNEDGRRRGYYPPLEGTTGANREDAILMSRRL